MLEVGNRYKIACLSPEKYEKYKGSGRFTESMTFEEDGETYEILEFDQLDPPIKNQEVLYLHSDKDFWEEIKERRLSPDNLIPSNEITGGTD